MFKQSIEHEKIMTIERHIFDEQQSHPEATGVLTSSFRVFLDGAMASEIEAALVFGLEADSSSSLLPQS